MSSLLARMRGAALLRADVYEEVEADPGSLVQAAGIVAGASLSNAAGMALVLRGLGLESASLVFQVAISALLPAVIWLGGSTFAYMAGGSFFRGPETESDFAELMRTTGFAFTPGWLFALSATPPTALGIAIAWAIRLWVLAAVVVAIRQALDFSTGRALGTFGTAAFLLWLVLWGLAAAPLPF